MKKKKKVYYRTGGEQRWISIKLSKYKCVNMLKTVPIVPPFEKFILLKWKSGSNLSEMEFGLEILINNKD